VLVIGIDPKPSRGGWVFRSSGLPADLLTTPCLATYLHETLQGVPTLICWDSPLTGSPNPAATLGLKGEFTKRCIERFFTTQGIFRVPSGISVQGFSGCQHWAISRHLIGLPRVGRFDRGWNELPFRLLTADGDRPHANAGSFIVEVHPALALWLWCRFVGGEEHRGQWNYKEDPQVRMDLWTRLCILINQFSPHMVKALAAPGPPQNDDDLDARLAWLLGKMWLNNVRHRGPGVRDSFG
jgi:Protein of unknown function (DUF429)